MNFKKIWEFLAGSFKMTLKGSWTYHAWMFFLAVLVVSGSLAYWRQFTEGLIVTNMRDQVSWAFYIGNFTFLVGVAAAAVLLVIPAWLSPPTTHPPCPSPAPWPRLTTC